MINKKIFNKLVDIAKKKETISYSQLASELKLKYDNVDNRNKVHAQLGKISEIEVKNNAPMLSVLVHHKGDIERTPGQGWFDLADKLKQRKDGETDKELQYRMIKSCWEYWKNKNGR